MVEPAIFFAIGFLVAALLALMAAPAVSRRATRLAIARARLQAPLSETQARAERDALRGEHAIEIARIERRLREFEDSRARALADLGRRAVEVVRLSDVSTERAAEIARQRTEIAGLQGDARDLAAQLSASAVALHDFERQRDAAREQTARARQRVVELETRVEENRGEIAGLETRLSSLEVELAGARRREAAATQALAAERERHAAALAERAKASSAFETEFGLARARLSSQEAELRERAAETAALRRHLAEVDPLLQRAEAKLETLGVENARLLQRLAERETELSFADREDVARELEQMRSRLAETSAAAQVIARGDQALRQAITRLGREIARAAEPSEEEEPAGQIVNFTRRDAGHTSDETEGQTSLSRPRIL